MKHQKWIENYEENFEKLATEVRDLRYDPLETFLSMLSKKIKQDSIKNADRNRMKLAKSLELCSQNLEEASRKMVL